MPAPGIEVVVTRPRAPVDALRADIAGFAGIFERGPVLVAYRVEDWGELREVFGDFVPMPGIGPGQALGPLALQGFYVNGGGTAYVFRLASPGMRAAFATVPSLDGTGTVRLTASSPGAWANRVKVRIPLQVRKRRGAAATIASLAPTSSTRFLVRAVGEEGVAFAVIDPSPGNVAGAFAPAVLSAIGEIRAFEEIVPIVNIVIEGAGRREQLGPVSLLPKDPAYPHIWRFLEVKGPVGPEWRPAVPDWWPSLDEALSAALAEQGPGESALVRARRDETVPCAGASTGAKHLAGEVLEVCLHGGCDALEGIDAACVAKAIAVLARHPAPSVIAVPDLMLSPGDEGESEDEDKNACEAPTPCRGAGLPPKAPAFCAEAEALQETLLIALASSPEGRERIALVDASPGVSPSTVGKRAGDLAQLWQDAGAYGAMLYPWIRTLDPAAGGRRTVLVPPSGHVAGMLAQAARERGPAGRFAGQLIGGAIAVERALSIEERASLNDAQVSAIHVIAGRGVVLFGARSLYREPPGLPRPRSVLRYLPDARALAFVRRMLRVTGEALVFEPNNELLRLTVRVALESRLGALFLQGAFAGATAAESYRVRCDEATQPPDARALGLVVAEVDVALAVPLEFLTLRAAFAGDGAVVLDGVFGGG